MDIKTFTQIAPMYPAWQALLLRGPTGIGKSAVVAQIAKQLGMDMVDVRTAVMQEGDFNGIPNLERMAETQVASNLMYGWFVRACNEPVILFLDEFPRAMMPVLQGTLQLVLDRALSNDEHGNPYTLHPETRVYAAGNFGAEYEGEDLDPAMLRRFAVFDLDPSTEDWLGWAKEKGDAGVSNIDPIIIEFIKENGTLLRMDPTETPGAVVPNNASWHRLSDILRHAEIAPKGWAGGKRPPGAWAITKSLVGDLASGKLMDFVERFKLLMTAEDVLDRYEENKDRIEIIDTVDAIDLAERVIRHLGNKGIKRGQVDNLMAFLDGLAPEIFMNSYALIGVINSSQNNAGKMSKVWKILKPSLMPLVASRASARNQAVSEARRAANDAARPANS